MLWVAWRQFRVQAAVALGALLLLAVLMLLSGLHLRDLYHASGVGTCGAQSDCGALDSTFVAHDLLLDNLITYQPAGRYWRFQIDEMTIFLILGLLLIGICFWWFWRGSPAGRRTPTLGRRPVARTIESRGHDEALKASQRAGSRVTAEVPRLLATPVTGHWAAF